MTWRSAHEAHAIERATFIMSFQDELPTKMLNSAVDVVSDGIVAQGFHPFASQVPGNIIYHGLNQNPIIQHPAEGRGFQLVRAGELIEEVIFQRNFIAYATTRYTRWKAVMSRIAALVGPAAERLIPNSNISSLKIEYFDRFVFDGEREAADFKWAFKENSKYVPLFYRDMKDLWHSHIGYFEATPNGYKRLINANIDVLDVMPTSQGSGPTGEPRRSIGIYTMAEDRFFTASSPIPPQGVDDIVSIADDMHVALKGVLREVISPALVESISLDSKGA